MNYFPGRRWFFHLISLIGLLVAFSSAAAPGGKGKPDDGTPPELEFWADKSAYTTGDSATLRWTSSGTKFCSASGDWTGKLPIEGSYTTAALDSSRSYSLKCNSRGGGVEQTLFVEVGEAATVPEEPAPDPSPDPAPVPAPEPVVQLSSSTTVVESGGMVALNWSSSDATVCTASDGWNGDKLIAGSEMVGPVYGGTSFTLTCTGDGGSAIATASVDVRSSVSLSWEPPTQNVDGTPLTDLSGYRIYFGETSREYSESLNVTDPATDTQAVELVSGTWFIAMTAIDADGNESGLSNEVTKTAP